MGSPDHAGQSSFAALSQRVKTKSSFWFCRSFRRILLFWGCLFHFPRCFCLPLSCCAYRSTGEAANHSAHNGMGLNVIKKREEAEGCDIGISVGSPELPTGARLSDL